MKNFLFFTILLLPFLSFSQITFEEINSPPDYNLRVIQKSQTGEFFSQAVNDRSSIYTSTNGTDWEIASLPTNTSVSNTDIQFFDDGTPIIAPSDNEHLIRRNGIWYTMNITGSWQDIETSFIKEDTLFVYQNQTFAYSLDYGETFTNLFQYNGFLVDHTAHLWKFNNHFVLHHTAGASDSLSVFTESGNLIFREGINLYIQDFIYNDCEEIFFIDDENHYHFQLNGLNLNSAPTTDIFYDYGYNSEIIRQGDNYYLKHEDTIFISSGCTFNFTPLVDDLILESYEELSVSALEDLFLYNNRDNHYLHQPGGSSQWEEEEINIDYAYVLQATESITNHQFSNTHNASFHKTSNGLDWIEMDHDNFSLGYQPQYSPNGDIYMNTGLEILYSQDNGESFINLAVPPTVAFSDLYVLDDNVLVMTGFLDELHYSVNNGQDWVLGGNLFFFGNPQFKYTGASIYILEPDFDVTATKIDIATNTISSEVVGALTDWNGFSATIFDDGTMYIHAASSIGQPTGLYSYQFGEDPVYIDEFPELQYTTFFSTFSDELFAFKTNTCYRYDGGTVDELGYVGLPTSGSKQFWLADSEVLYVVIDNHRIFKSTAPLAEPNFVSGSIYHDMDLDCTDDDTEDQLQYWKVTLENDNYLRIKTTNLNGDFNFAVPFGDYTISSQPITSNWELCESSHELTIDAANTDINQNFQAKALVDCADLEIDFSAPLLRRCFENYYAIRVRNTGPLPTIGTTLTLSLDQFFDLTSVSIPYTELSPDVIEVDLGILELNDEVVFYIYFEISCDAELGAEHCLTGALTDVNLCQQSVSPSYTECQENIGSYDPNDKRAFNEAGMETTTVDKDEFIYYHIRFQNTGTDTAFTVKVVDPLSPILDLSTLEMLSSSHPYTYVVNDGPELVVTFDDILLPDSTTNELASHGFFKFKIKPIASFDYGTSIPNEAGIFFDFNDPVITNDATIIIQQPVSTSEATDLIKFDISPNPTHHMLRLSIEQSDLNRIDAYAIYNQLGQEVAQHSELLNNNSLDVTTLVPGVYYLTLKENGARIGVRKFVKQ